MGDSLKTARFDDPCEILFRAQLRLRTHRRGNPFKRRPRHPCIYAPSDGIYSFKIHSALDTGELLSSSCSSAIEVDTTPPVLSDATISFGPGGITDPLRLARGAITGTYSSHCILENSLNVGSCTWTNGSLPETFESQSQGSVTLTLFLRDSVGNVSDPVSTNTLNLSPVPPPFRHR